MRRRLSAIALADVCIIPWHRMLAGAYGNVSYFRAQLPDEAVDGFSLGRRNVVVVAKEYVGLHGAHKATQPITRLLPLQGYPGFERSSGAATAPFTNLDPGQSKYVAQRFQSLFAVRVLDTAHLPDVHQVRQPRP